MNNEIAVIKIAPYRHVLIALKNSLPIPSGGNWKITKIFTTILEDTKVDNYGGM